MRISCLEFSDTAQAALRQRWSKLHGSSSDGKQKFAHTAEGVPTFRHWRVACAQCSKTQADLPAGKKLLACAACKVVSYCSKACQQAHWKRGHRKQCRQLRDTKVSQKQQEKGGGDKRTQKSVLKAVRRLVKRFAVAGDRVTITGLKSKSEWNGKTGTIVTNLDPATGRYVVRVVTGAMAKLKRANVIVSYPDLSTREFVPPDRRSPLGAHLKAFCPNGNAFMAMLRTYCTVVESRSKTQWTICQQMAASHSPEALMAKMICGHVLEDATVCKSLRIEPSAPRACTYYREAAEGGFAFAFKALGDQVREGVLGPSDDALACALYAKAFDIANLPEAAFNVGVFHGVVGFRGEVDRATAARWYSAGVNCDLSCESKYKGLMVLGGRDSQEDFLQFCRRNLNAVSRFPEVKKMMSTPRP